MDKNKTQALLPCELDCPHLDISTHGEGASVGAVTSALACLVHFLSADMILNWLTRYTSYKKHCWIISFVGDLTPFGGYFHHCPVVLIYNSGSYLWAPWKERKCNHLCRPLYQSQVRDL